MHLVGFYYKNVRITMHGPVNVKIEFVLHVSSNA